MYFILMKIKFEIKNLFMKTKFKIGDKVGWSSKAEEVLGTIIKIDLKVFNQKSYKHHGKGAEERLYEISSDKTDHIAAHKGSAITKH